MTPLSSSGLGYRPLTAETGVRVPVGVWSARVRVKARTFASPDGRLAQLVERHVHIVDVAGSSPAATMQKAPQPGWAAGPFRVRYRNDGEPTARSR